MEENIRLVTLTSNGKEDNVQAQPYFGEIIISVEENGDTRYNSITKDQARTLGQWLIKSSEEQ